MREYAVCLCLLIVSLSFVQELPKPIPGPGEVAQPKQNSSTNKDDVTQTPDASRKSFTFPINRQHSAAIGDNEVHDPEDHKGETSSDNRIIWLTAGLLVAALIQAGIYYRQSELMRKQLKIAVRSARAAQRGAAIARETLRISQRAYLGTENWQFRYDEKSLPIKIDVALYNSGATPARVIGTAWKAHIVKKLPPPPDPFQTTIKPMKPMPIQPKRNTVYAVDLIELLKGDALAEIRAKQPLAHLVDDRTINALVMQIVRDGKMFLYLEGFIIYETIDLCFLLALFIQYDQETDRFVAVGEPGYNYEVPYENEKNKE